MMQSHPTKGEKLAEKVLRLARELDEAKRQMDSCSHEVGKPVRAVRDTFEAVFVRYEGRGSEPEPIYDMIPKKEYGWERSCTKCGYTQYTTRTKPIVVGSEPDFGARGD